MGKFQESSQKTPRRHRTSRQTNQKNIKKLHTTPSIETTIMSRNMVASPQTTVRETAYAFNPHSELEAPGGILDDEEGKVAPGNRLLLHSPRPFCTKDTIHFGMIYASFGMIFLLFCMTIAVCTYTSPLLSQIHLLINDSEETIHDVKRMVPEVQDALDILDKVCEHPYAHDYCYGTGNDTGNDTFVELSA